MELFQHTILFSKESSYFRMLESKLWHNKTETKNVKVAKMVEFIETCDQYPRKFNFGHFFSSIILPHFEKMGNSLLFGVVMIKTWGRVLLRGVSKNEHI